jgi:Ni/Co efflux regulator RcnB
MKNLRMALVAVSLMMVAAPYALATNTAQTDKARWQPPRRLRKRETWRVFIKNYPLASGYYQAALQSLSPGRHTV